ncbi:hypothetical protein [Nannocystis sp.]|uniref:hypothetical protein n=1 Tax=Nannocystis sp. TaxID=1962667 RepID=UPI0025D98C83|nr:hypothetical protein [Nannocystis sp.]MBK7830521.1 hypothetical protein [Nannocystis sp.]
MADASHSPQQGSPRPAAAPVLVAAPMPVAVPVLAAAGAIAGLLQLIAGVALGLASPEALHRAARAGPRSTILLVLALASCGLLAWILRRRTAAAAGLGLAGPLLAGLILWKSGLSKLGLAYHGEFILHHFLALVCAALCLAIPLQWLRAPRLAAARWRFLPAAPASVGALLLLLEHLRGDSDLTGPIGQVGTALSLATWPIALAVLWPTLGPPRLRAWLLVSTLPALVRVGLGGAAALAGVPLGLAAATPLMSAVVIASLVGLPLLRPQLDRLLQVIVSVGAGVMTLGLHRVYLQRFGDLEGDLGGLVRSLFGFDLPYPGYVPGWRLGAAMLGLFVLLTTVSGALISQRDHIRGLGLALMISGGLGLGSPQLVLMLCAGYLVLLDATAGAPPDPGRRGLRPAHPARRHPHRPRRPPRPARPRQPRAGRGPRPLAPRRARARRHPPARPRESPRLERRAHPRHPRPRQTRGRAAPRRRRSPRRRQRPPPGDPPRSAAHRPRRPPEPPHPPVARRRAPRLRPPARRPRGRPTRAPARAARSRGLGDLGRQLAGLELAQLGRAV